MGTRRRLAVVLLALCAFVSQAGAAVVTLKDGSRLRGTVTGQAADGIELKTPDGTLHISQSRILTIDYSDEAPAAPPTAPPTAPPGVEQKSAVSPEGKHFVSLGIGFDVPANGVDFRSLPGGGEASNGDLGVQFSAQYLYYLTPRLGAGMDFDYFDRAYTDSPGLFPNANSSVAGYTTLFLGIVRYTLVDDGWIRPFVLAGAGGARNSTTVDVRAFNWSDTNTHEVRRLVDDTVWAPAASARVGFDFYVAPVEPGVITFEAGWTGLASERYGATPQGRAQGISGVSGPLNYVTFTARYGWRF
ncbi:MAG TPA: hypothetical protein VN915_07500 [Elusimicrobiota bacterium]|nr:hypothetical protein [Elusimicrobiota bacterium]